MKIIGGKVFDPNLGFVNKDLCINDDRISNHSEGAEINAIGCYIIPGLTDLHFHACMGEDISDGSLNGLKVMARYELKNGITQICPTTMAMPAEKLLEISEKVSEFKQINTGADFIGINLEGPFLSHRKCGAHNPKYLQLPNKRLFDMLYVRSDAMIKIITISPELPGAMEFVKYASEKVIVSLGHTEADYDLSCQAIKAGARQITHLFNAMPGLLHRRPGLIGAAVDNPTTYVELISDGIHIHPSAIRAAFRLFGGDRVILISDSMRATGLEDGIYNSGDQDVTVIGKQATLNDGTIAGSVTNLFGCMQKAIGYGITPFDAIKAATVNPAKALDIYENYGSLDIGKVANILILNDKFEIRNLIFHGELI